MQRENKKKTNKFQTKKLTNKLQLDEIILVKANYIIEAAFRLLGLVNFPLETDQIVQQKK